LVPASTRMCIFGLIAKVVLAFMMIGLFVVALMF
jgi:hypothetical protein